MCSEQESKPIPMTTGGQLLLTATNRSKNGLLIARRIILAGTSAERRRGLLGHTSLDADDGLYLAPCEWVHTFGMKFPIDIAFLSRDGRVLALHHSLKPNRISKLVWRAEGLLELAAGRLHESGTEVGDMIELCEVPQSS